MRHRSRVLVVAVGLTAVGAPLLHSASDLMELISGGFTDAQLWLNMAAFVPMPVLLLGIWVVATPRAGIIGLVGALMYGSAFAYFFYTTVYALTHRVSTYEVLWAELGITYTLFGVVMIVGGLLFAYAGLRARWQPRWAITLFAIGVLINLAVGVMPVPDVVQTLGSAVRNAGLMAIGIGLLMSGARRRSR